MLAFMTSVPNAVELTLNAKRIRSLLYFLVGAQIVFVGGDVIFNFYDVCDHLQIRRLFNVAKEGSIPSWYGVTQTFLLGLICLLLAPIVHFTKPSKFRGLFWSLIGLFFCYLSMDDGSQIHERLGTVVKDLRDIELLRTFSFIDHYPSYTWQLVLGPPFALCGVLLFAFLLRELSTTKLRIGMCLALTCWCIAVGLDFLEGVDGSLAFLEPMLGVGSYPLRHFSKVLEECLEMLGTSFFIVTFLAYFVQLQTQVIIQPKLQ